MALFDTDFEEYLGSLCQSFDTIAKAAAKQAAYSERQLEIAEETLAMNKAHFERTMYVGANGSAE